MEKQKIHKNAKIKRTLIKAGADVIKKTIELSILAIVLGVTLRVIALTVPAVAVGATIAQIIKINFSGA